MLFMDSPSVVFRLVVSPFNRVKYWEKINLFVKHYFYFIFFYCEDLLQQRKLGSIQISCVGLSFLFMEGGGVTKYLLQSYADVKK